MQRSSMGILGLGVHLPPGIRTNDWWAPAVVERWRQRQGGNFASAGGLVTDSSQTQLPEGGQRVLDAILAEREDVFQGTRERRIAADDVLASDMETDAARAALADAGVEAAEIDFVLSYSTCPDFLMAPNACAIHHKLGLNERCLSLATEGACNSFLMQLALAEQLIAGGRFKRGLLVQSSICSRLVPPEQPSSTMLGDAATAMVVGPVAAGYGLLGQSHSTNGEHFNALAVGVPGKRWYEDGRNVFYAADKDVARKLILNVADRARGAICTALEDAGHKHADVTFYASHQGTSWLRAVTQEFAGLGHTRSVDTFPWAASVMGVNVPLVLAAAVREGKLREGDLAVAFSGGLGETWSSVVIRWGRG